MLLIGDSIGVGIAPHLYYHAYTEAKVGRTLEQGMDVLKSLRDKRDDKVLVIILGTNNDPRRVGILKLSIRQALRFVGADGCVVWATVRDRPGYNYRQWNNILRVNAKHDERFVVAEIGEMGSIGPDGIHPTPYGYKKRGQLVSRKMGYCMRLSRSLQERSKASWHATR